MVEEMPQAAGRARQCPYCSREFIKADHYHRHIRSHTKEKPFRCNICRKAYPRHDTLLRHTRTHQKASHSKPKPTEDVSSNNRRSVDSGTSPSGSCPPAPYTFLPPYEVVQPGMEQTSNPTSGFRKQNTQNTQTTSYDESDTNIVSLPVKKQPQCFTEQRISITTGFQGTSNNYGSDTFRDVTHGIPSVSATGTTEGAFTSQTGDVYSPLQTEAFASHFDGLNPVDWLLGDDFDLTAFDFVENGNVLEDSRAFTHHTEELGQDTRRTSDVHTQPRLLDLRPIWYTQVRSIDTEYGASSGSVTPNNAGNPVGDSIDEVYRMNMAKRLRIPLRDEPLPSIDFLNLCIHLFFTRFNVTLPIIHSPTFRPTKDNALLVLSICSAGSLSLGSDMADKAGSMLFERVNKAVLAAPWERHHSHRPEQVRNMLKTAMIGQTFALLSGNPFHLMTAAAYLGSLITLARHSRLFHNASAISIDEDLSPEALDATWRRWARDEELKRIALVLFIHDAEISALFHHDPILRHNATFIPTASSAELFCAPTAVAWASKYKGKQAERLRQARQTVQPPDRSCTRNPSQPSSSDNSWSSSSAIPSGQYHMLNVYTRLSGIAASISECRHLGSLSSEQAKHYESDLITWYTSVPAPFRELGNTSMQPEAPFSMLPLWHYTFMTLTTDFETLELAIGRDGAAMTPSTGEYALSWISSPDSKRCLLHALLLQNLVASVNMGSFFPIHAARILFSAAVCWYCYMLYLPYTSVSDHAWVLSELPELSLETLPEIKLLREGAFISTVGICNDTISDFKRILIANPAEMKASTLCVLEGILRRLGTGDISKVFADIVQVFISGEMDKVTVDAGAARDKV
ncbi:hypothetical protein LTR72_003953 [Exophiala xenobiotica]|nr:hypothetical protein LTR72_003953 [Exophiala xenobiotica]KAK5298870.1 hypothetical protein LTR14_002722 [Exophiala xenobiotica]KAK5494268.1 hypothetical protein LTR55_002654 [Exophiala xenobiotica]